MMFTGSPSIEIEGREAWLRANYKGHTVVVGAWDGMVEEPWSDIDNGEPLDVVSADEWAAILTEAQTLIAKENG